MTTYKGLTVEIGATTKDLQKALSEANKGARQTANELKQIEKALDFNPISTRLLTRQVELIGDKADQTRKRLEVLKAAEEQIGRANMSTEQWTKLQAEIATCESKLETFTNQLAKARIELSSASTLMGRTGASLTDFGERYQSAGDRLKSVGSTLTNTVTPAIGILGGATIAAATSIDTSLTGVKKTVDGTAQQYEQLKDAAIDFSKTNAVSASQILDIQALGAQLGFTIDELQLFSEVVSGLDIATNMDAETAATEVAQFANITRMSHDEVENYGSAIVGLGNNFATTEAEISSMAMRIAAAGTQVGMSQADILGLATALSSLGMEAEAGGSAISTIISNIDKTVATNSDTLATWASAAGMSAESFASAWKSGPVDALALVLSGLQGATEAGGNMSLMLEELGINELRQTDSMKRMAGNAQLVTDAVATANDEWSKNTALSKEVENRNDSLAAKFEMLKNRAVAVADDIGGPLADALLEALDAAQPLFDAIESGTKTFADMSDGEQQAVLATVGLVAAAGPLLSAAGRIPDAASLAGSAIKTMSQNIAEAASDASLLAPAASQASSAMSGVEKSTDGATRAVKAGRVAIAALGTALKTVGITAAVAAIGAMAAYMADAKAKADTLKNATEGLSEAVGLASADFSGTSSVVEAFSESIGDVTASAQECIESQSDLANSISDSWSDIGTNSALLDRYVSSIERLSGQSGLTAQEQAELQGAISGVNEICGTSYEVIDAQNDVLSASTDAIKANTDAWVANARAQAAQEQMVELQKQEIETSMALADAKKNIADMESEFQGVRKAALAGDREAIARESELTNKLSEERSNRDALTQSLQENKAAQETLSGIYSQAQESLTGTTEKISEFIGANAEWSEALSNSGIDIDSFAQRLSELGVKTGDLAGMTAEQLVMLANNAGLSAQEIVAAFDAAGIGIPDALRSALQGGASAVVEGAASLSAAAAQAKSGFITVFNSMTGEVGLIAASSMDAATQATYAGTPGFTAAVEAAKNGASVAFDPITGEFQVTASTAVMNAAGAITAGTSAVEDASQGVGDAATWAFDPIKQVWYQIGSEASSNAASGIESESGAVQSSAAGAKDVADSEFGKLPGSTGAYGSGATDNLADGLSSSSSAVSSQASTVSAYVESWKFLADSAFQWGSHVSTNFASGINSGQGTVAAAAQRIAEAAAANLKFTAPKEGPFSGSEKGGVTSGLHLAQNFADGMSDGARYVGKSALEIAQTVVDYLGHSQPEKGPLRGGEWVYGYHAATNFADGLYSGAPEVAEAAAEVASGVSAGMEEGADEGDAEMRAYVDGMIAGWEDRSDEIRETSTAIGDALWGGIYQSVMSSPWRKPATGAVCDSMKVLEAYGHDLESYKDKVAEFGEKRAEWDSKLAGEMSDTDWQSYNEWLSDYNDFTDMQSKLTASMSDMEEWASLYALKDAAISGIDNAQAWSDALSKLTGKTGVVFRKEFVDAVVDGGDEYLEAIQQMGDMADEQVQGMVDAFTDLSLAQRQQELDQRSLYVNSLQYSDMTTPKERMLDFRETLLDVKEAVYSDAGLSGAFEKAGVSIEGFGADLQSLDVTMEDFVSGLDGYASAVSNGFSQFTKHGKTGLDEWEETLRLNMAESQAWADNLEAVFAKVPESIDSEAFRKAVYEGGFDQWGQVIADMAGKSSEEIASYIRLYNESVAQAQTDGLDAFRALAPGEEMVNTIIAGITAQQPALDQSVVDASTASNEAMLETSPQWYSTGVGLAGQISSGIQSQISAIASAAASTVRAAIEAAQAAAGSGVSAATANMPATASMSRGPSVPTAATLASSQSVRSVPSASPVSMSFTVNTQPGQTVDVRQLAKEINKMQDRAMRAKGL